MVGGGGVFFRITAAIAANHTTERGVAIVGGLAHVESAEIVKLIRLLQITDAIVDGNFQVSHTLHLGVLIDGPQREPVVLVVVLVQIFPLNCDLPVRFVLLQVSIPVPHVHRQVAETARYLELVLLAKERTERPLDRRRPTDFLLVQCDRTVHIAVFLRAR